MKYYVGIDLGTTNSSIASYDGRDVRIWKSPEQNDVTPSAIYVDKRGNRYFGSKAYSQASYNPSNSATLFKRFMGTNMQFKLEASGLTYTPEECSAEILKVLYGYLPEEIRNSNNVATVITVPAAFNQMKKNATLHAAKLAGLGNVTLIQEPVAAIMSVMKTSQQSGIFLIYDLGGGTFDVSIAENINGKVNLLAHGGIEMCGGRDIDRMIFNQLVMPWLNNTFTLPNDFLVSKNFKSFRRIAQWATERAKIELSPKNESTIALSEYEARTHDSIGNEIYIDIPLSRSFVDTIISDLINETIESTKDTLSKAGLTANDIVKIVFIGGPTNYKPLRDQVTNELSLNANLDINPMTAVAEGACIFAESIDWSTENHSQKPNNASVTTELNLSFKYITRTPSNTAKIMCIFAKEIPGYMIEFTSMDSGWTSGHILLAERLIIDLPLIKNGENNFIATVFNEFGQKQQIEDNQITITKTLASIGVIPASHSIGVEVLDKLGGVPMLAFLVNEGDALPKTGSHIFKAGQTLKAGSNASINIKLWEGDIQNPITDNQFIGVLKISGTAFDSGVITTGATIECNYEISDSGTIDLEVSIPSVGMSFSDNNLYSRQEGQFDLKNIDSIAEESRSLIERINEISIKVNDPLLKKAKIKAESAANISEDIDPEDVEKAINELLEVKKLINKVRQKYLQIIWDIDLNNCVDYFNQSVRKYAKNSEQQSFDNLTSSAQRAIHRNDPVFENILKDMYAKSSTISLRQDWIVIDFYHRIIMNPSKTSNPSRFIELKSIGDHALESDDIDQLRNVLFQLISILIDTKSFEKMYDISNILEG